jgi:hypothetical protein
MVDSAMLSITEHESWFSDEGRKFTHGYKDALDGVTLYGKQMLPLSFYIRAVSLYISHYSCCPCYQLSDIQLHQQVVSIDEGLEFLLNLQEQHLKGYAIIVRYRYVDGDWAVAFSATANSNSTPMTEIQEPQLKSDFTKNAKAIHIEEFYSCLRHQGLNFKQEQQGINAAKYCNNTTIIEGQGSIAIAPSLTYTAMSTDPFRYIDAGAQLINAMLSSLDIPCWAMPSKIDKIIISQNSVQPLTCICVITGANVNHSYFKADLCFLNPKTHTICSIVQGVTLLKMFTLSR